MKKRAIPTERLLARVFRDAFLRDMNVGAPATDTRRIEVLAEDLPSFAGAQLAVDIALRCALTRNSEAQPQAENTDGAVLSEARRDPGAADPWWSVIETGGRWSDEATELMRQLAHARARDVPRHLSRPAEVTWERRWTRMLSTACAISFATSLVEPVEQCDLACRTGGQWRAAPLVGLARGGPAGVEQF